MTLDEKRDLITAKALEYLKKTLFADNPQDAPDYLLLQLDAHLKVADFEQYEYDLKLFKALFNSHDEDLLDALWNAIFIPDEIEFSDDFNIEELDFLLSVQKAHEESPNSNEPITTDRIILRDVAYGDMPQLYHHFEQDGDFDVFSLMESSGHEISLAFRYAYRRRPLSFAIEDRNSNTLVGCVGLAYLKEKKTATLDYYIFKEQRQKGYCKEAVSTLINQAFDGKLIYPYPTVRFDVYERKYAEFVSISAEIYIHNEASIALAKSCGLKYFATHFNAGRTKALGNIDKVEYVLKNPNI